MEFDKIIDMVVKNEHISEKASQSERLCYLSIQYLMALHKIGRLTTEQASDEKLKIKLAFEKQYEYEQAKLNDWDYSQANIRLAASLRSQINKSTNITEIAKYAIECISLMTGDETFYTDNIKKI